MRPRSAPAMPAVDPVSPGIRSKIDSPANDNEEVLTFILQRVNERFDDLQDGLGARLPEMVQAAVSTAMVPHAAKLDAVQLEVRSMAEAAAKTPAKLDALQVTMESFAQESRTYRENALKAAEALADEKQRQEMEREIKAKLLAEQDRDRLIAKHRAELDKLEAERGEIGVRTGSYRLIPAQENKRIRNALIASLATFLMAVVALLAFLFRK